MAWPARETAPGGLYRNVRLSHGQQYLVGFLLTLNLLAFPFHKVLGLVESKKAKDEQRIGS